MSFEEELSALLNKYSQENGSDTPDFILAAYLNRCLTNWNITMSVRKVWYTPTVEAATNQPQS